MNIKDQHADADAKFVEAQRRFDSIEHSHRAAVHNALRSQYAADAMAKMPSDATHQQLASAAWSALAAADTEYAADLTKQLLESKAAAVAAAKTADALLEQLRAQEPQPWAPFSS